MSAALSLGLATLGDVVGDELCKVLVAVGDYAILDWIGGWFSSLRRLARGTVAF